jgi:hypothetical protein
MKKMMNVTGARQLSKNEQKNVMGGMGMMMRCCDPILECCQPNPWWYPGQCQFLPSCDNHPDCNGCV